MRDKEDENNADNIHALDKTQNDDSCENCFELNKQLAEAKAKCESLADELKRSNERNVQLEEEVKNEKFKFQKISKALANQTIKNELLPHTVTTASNVIFICVQFI